MPALQQNMEDQMTDRPRPIEAPELEGLGKHTIRHGFFTREGGVSKGIYAGLNVGAGSDDDQMRVSENRKRVAETMGVAPDHLVNLYQIHSADVISIKAPFSGERPKADALVTDVPGLALGVLTADCGPVLFADSEHGVIGAAHAGWRGALGGVLENTICAMEALGAKRDTITAVLGPCIGPKNYEVGQEFYDSFVGISSNNVMYFTPSSKSGHYLFNLWSFIKDALRKSGVTPYSLDICTYSDESRFYSYRRKTHRNEVDYGRQISTIILGNPSCR